jgi:hypothetical protein
LAVNNNLWVKSNWSWGQILGQDVESISEGSSGSLSPARSAINWNMLVNSPRGIVNSVNVSPVIVLWKAVLRNNIPSHWPGNNILKEWVFLDCATFVASIFKEARIFWVWAVWSFLFVSWIILFIISCNVLNFISPSVYRGGKGAVGFNTNVVGASDYTEEAALAPGGAPGVSGDPVLLTVFLAEADNGDFVDEVGIAGLVFIDAAVVGSQGVRHCDGASNGTSLVNFLDHGIFTSKGAELINSVDVI